MPQAIVNRPKLEYVDRPYIECFWELHNARGYDGFAGRPQALQMVEINAWLQIHQIDSVSGRCKYVRLVQLLDATYIGYYAEERSKNKG